MPLFKKKGEEGENKGENKGEEGENKGENKGESKKGKSGCPDMKNPECIAKGIGETLMEPAKAFENTRNALIDGAKQTIKNTGEKVVGVVLDKAKCVAFFGKELPEIIPNMIGNIFDKTVGGIEKVSGAADKFAASIGNVFKELGGQEIKGYPNIFGPFEVLYAMIIIKIQGVINKIVLGANANQILGDPKMDPKHLLDELLKNSEKYKLAANDKEFKRIFEEWLANYVEAVLRTINLAQPSIDKVKDKISGIINGLGDKIGSSVNMSLTNIIQSIFTAVPGLGTVMSVIYAGERVGKTIIDSCEAPLSKGAGLILPLANKVNLKIAGVENDLECLAKKLDPVVEKIFGKAAPNAAAKQEGGADGGSGNGNDQKRKIHRATRKATRKATHRVHRRVEILLQQFNRKPVKRPNYSRRLKLRTF